MKRLMSCAIITPMLAASPAFADRHHDLTTPTGWTHHKHISVDALNNVINHHDQRIVDLEIAQASGQVTFNVATVTNSGDYGSGWWWYYDKTIAEIENLLAENDARLLDVEPYYNWSLGLRYAAVMVPNQGPDPVQESGFVAEKSFDGLVDWMQSNPDRRIHDLEVQSTASGPRYTFTWINNTGAEGSAWWIYIGTTLDQINASLGEHDARLVDLEHFEDGTWSAIMLPNDGQAWSWIHGVEPQQVMPMVGNLASRIVDVEYYHEPWSGQERAAVIMRRNANDLTIEANIALREDVPLTASSGLFSKRINGPIAAEVNRDLVFEPASAIKVLHLYTALQQTDLNADEDLADPVAYPTPGNYPWGNWGSHTAKDACPHDQDQSWVIRNTSLTDTLKNMMYMSSNPATEAIRSRYGTDLLIQQAAWVGANSTKITHTHGCLGHPDFPYSRNETTLSDMSKIHSGVVNGQLGSLQAEFFEHMGEASYFETILQEELASSGLDADDQSEILARADSASKGGSYGVIGNGRDEGHVTVGSYLRLPVRQADCEVEDVEYFVGMFINDAPINYFDNNIFSRNLEETQKILYRDRIRAAIATWQTTDCDTAEPGDLNGDGKIDGADMGQMLMDWGVCDGCASDLDGDGDVDGADFGRFLMLWRD